MPYYYKLALLLLRFLYKYNVLYINKREREQTHVYSNIGDTNMHIMVLLLQYYIIILNYKLVLNVFNC